MIAHVRSLPLSLLALATGCGSPPKPATPAHPDGRPSPRLAVDLPPLARYSAPCTFDEEPEGAIAVDVIAEDDDSSNLLGIFEGALYFVRSRELFRRTLPDGPEVALRGDVERDLAIAVDGDEVIFSTRDCEVSSTKQHRLGGECQARVRDVFVDQDSIFIVADQATEWRQSQAALFRMPRRRSQAARVATLPRFDRLMGLERVLFDADSFYYLDLFGTVRRVSKQGGDVESFLGLDITKAQQLEFVDSGAIYVTSGGSLFRVPRDGSDRTVVGDGLGGDFATDGRRLYTTTDRGLFAAPLSGGCSTALATLPEGGWRPSALGGKVFLHGWDSVLKVDPEAKRSQKMLEVDDEVIGSLSVDARGVFFTTERGGVWSFSLLPHGAAEPKGLFEVKGLASAPALDGNDAYYLMDDGALVRHGMDGRPPVSIVSGARFVELAQKTTPGPERWRRHENEGLPRDVVVDADDVYVLNATLGAVFAVPKSGGAPALVVAVEGLGLQLLVDDAFVYLRREAKDGWGILRAPKRPATALEVLLRTTQTIPLLAVTSDGPLWTTGDRTVAFSRRVGFSVQGPLARNNSLATLVARGDTLFYAFGKEPDAELYIGSLRLGETQHKIYAQTFTTPTSLSPTDDALYVVELGFAASPKSSRRRVECCAIWRLPR